MASPIGEGKNTYKYHIVQRFMFSKELTPTLGLKPPICSRKTQMEQNNINLGREVPFYHIPYDSCHGPKFMPSPLIVTQWLQYHIHGSSIDCVTKPNL